MERLLTADEVAVLLQVPKATLYAWRYQGKGPPSLKVGRHIRYSSKALDRWLVSCAADRRHG